MIFIKNISGDELVIRGHIIADNAYKFITEVDSPEWYRDDSVMSAINSNEVQVAKSNDGEQDIQSTAEQFLYLSGYRVQKVVNELAEGGLKKSDRGYTFLASHGASTVGDYLITEDLQIKGGILLTDNNHILDSVSMEIVDTSFLYAGEWYPATPTEAGIVGVEGLTWAQVVPSGVSLHHYLKDFPVSKDGVTKIKNDAITNTPLNGLTIRVTYNSNGDTDINCNIGIVAYS